MSGSEKRSFALLLIPITALTVFLAPSLARSDPFLILHTGRNLQSAHETREQLTKRTVTTVGLNENGDLTIRRSDVSLILAYNPPNEIIDYQERIKIAQRQDCPAISGISLRVSILF